MFIAKVVGSVVATRKTGVMVGHELLLVESYRLDESRTGMKAVGRSHVVVDALGAAEGEYVLVVQGSSARMTPETRPLPVDAAVVGIVDSVHVGQTTIRFE
ncbi:MAG TPA: ethanolamine utilization protein EutN [Planctomycetaceae bacterium]|nr:ethanolamine utilization protein EutN [Planctomycetaceae bacterium]